MRVVLTRAGQEGSDWAQALRSHGHDVLELPLLAVGPAPDPAACHRAREAIAGYAAAMFVSGNAVRALLADAPVSWPSGTRAWATGPGTVRALRAADVPQACIDAPPDDAAQFDSEHLWNVVARQVRSDVRVLLIRGADSQGHVSGRDWLGRRLEESGVSVDTIAAYSRRLPSWGATERDHALAAASNGSTWLFSSSEAAGNLLKLLPGVDWSAARAIATHERIAQSVREAGFSVVRTSRPDLAAVVAALESSG